MVVDVCTFNGEYDLWDLHYKCLEPYVDEFIVIEFSATFSGKEKPIYSDTIDKTKYPKAKFIVDRKIFYSYGEVLLAAESPQTTGAEHWKREFLQKESIKGHLSHLNDSDVVFIGDVDEIWHPRALKLRGTYKLKLKVYTYYLNLLSNEVFAGTLKTTYGHMKHLVLNHLRQGAARTREYYGWHFTSMGGTESLRKKLTDSYTQESYATPSVLENIAYNISNKRDFLGRNFSYAVDERGWPEYLKENKEHYRHLCMDSQEKA